MQTLVAVTAAVTHTSRGDHVPLLSSLRTRKVALEQRGGKHMHRRCTMKSSARLLGSAVVVAMALGCNADQPAGLDRPGLSARLNASTVSEAPLVEHIVAPQTTDPAIDQDRKSTRLNSSHITIS